MSRRGITRGLPQAHTAPTTGDGPVSFLPEATVQASAALAGDSPVGFTPAGAIGAFAEIAGDMPVGFTPAGTLFPIPTDSLALWLNPEGLTPGVIATWPDTSGNARDFSQTGGSDPTAVADGGPNNAPRVRFDANKFVRITGSPFAALTDAEFFAVWKFDAASTAGGTTNSPWYFCGAASNDLWKFSTGPNLYCGAGSTTRQTCGDPTQAMTDWHVANVISTASEFTVNVGTQALFTTGTNAVGFPATCVVGSGLVGGGASMVGDIAMVIVYGRKLSTDERNAVKGYLGSIFGAIPGV